MTRIIAGRWGGRRITTPAGDGTRPTSDRVRESVFASLNSLLGGFDGLRVLDLFAGSGALGLECVSRGAAHADLVESDARAARTIQRNVTELGASARVHRVTAQRYVAANSGPWDLVFLDPPYAVPTEEVASIVAALRPSLVEDAVVVVERSSRDEFTWPEGFDALRDKSYGETRLWYGH
ncbi:MULTISPECIES: 16S rRNA (guanine(966)-N(2))-methyltransferase RsmD [Aeromicrobium]|uniref:16S rRNA (guanine(966)-N(2))-methyltransferase RsmD n=1 Tax=Aeromicrobium TaxID=2040 RepID=UPI00257F5B04|nr:MULTISPECIES: 16S rRNA (guanine(966)-N(2))-methyltransferase RsmD [Aeromicrobium]